MAFQANLDYQVFWKPRSVVRNADADRQQSPASSASQRQSPSTGLRYAPMRQIDNFTAEVSPSPGLPASNCDAIYISDDGTAEISDIASVDDNLEHAQLDCTLPSVEALAASIKEQAQDADGISEYNRQAFCDNNHNPTSFPAMPAHQEARQSPSAASAASAASSVESPGHSSRSTPASTRASTPAVSQLDAESFVNNKPSCDVGSTQTICSPITTSHNVNASREPSPVQSQLPDGSIVEPDVHGRITDNSTEGVSSIRRVGRRIRRERLNTPLQSHVESDIYRQERVSIQSDTEYSPLSTDDEGGGDDYQPSDEDEGSQQGSRKRRKCSTPLRPKPRGKGDLLVPSMSVPSTEDDGMGAEFDEWPLQNVLLKRTLFNGRATFQLQFDWDICTKHGRETYQGPGRGHKLHKGTTGGVKRGFSARTRFTQEEDRLLIKSIEELELSWAEIHSRFINKFAGRSKRGSSGALLHKAEVSRMILG
ncbi:hypothetical protein ED733_000647 [Metarhizium rileyi]|uniref:Myb-like domain-containing protein n=1 Tax=Metarhizium rileyi (strain RCEF 4871) TaxID=1649241 RepID=A0A5C6G4W3_METRR|nr:hypothetical protein ED733_000647 [Metarhizium rileyi]